MGPDDLRAKAKQQCRWACPVCDHVYEATVANRTAGRGCPSCANVSRSEGRRHRPEGAASAADLAVFSPEELVTNLTCPGRGLSEMRPNAVDRCVWQCASCGHEWEATVVNRVSKRSGCPVCSVGRVASARRRPPSGGSLRDRYPDIAAEFIECERLPGLGAGDFRPGSNALARWKCRRGHVWVTTIASRVAGAGCARCSGRGQSRLEFEVAELLRRTMAREVVLDQTVLAAGRRWRIDLYVPSLNLYMDLDPARWHQDNGRDQRKSDALVGLRYVRIRPRDLAPLRDVWVLTVPDRTMDPVGWAQALRPIILESGGEWRSLREQDVADALAAAAKRWRETLRGRPVRSAIDVRPALKGEWLANLTRPGVGLDWLPPSARDTCAWRCRTCGHSWDTSVASRAGQGSDCPKCAKQRTANRVRRASIAQDDRSLASAYPAISASFIRCIGDPSRSPETLMPSSNLRCEWMCPTCENSFVAAPGSRVRRPDGGCRVCGHAKVGRARSRSRPGESLGDQHPDVAKELVEIVNRPGWDAGAISSMSNLRARWRCSGCHTEWTAQISSRAAGSGCPVCSRQSGGRHRRRPTTGRSLKDLYPDIAARFHENLTHPGSAPEDLRPGSHDRCTWSCPACKCTYNRVVKNAVRQGIRCPECKA